MQCRGEGAEKAAPSSAPAQRQGEGSPASALASLGAVEMNEVPHDSFCESDREGKQARQSLTFWCVKI